MIEVPSVKVMLKIIVIIRAENVIETVVEVRTYVNG
jgi:hypothetical protein